MRTGSVQRAFVERTYELARRADLVVFQSANELKGWDTNKSSWCDLTDSLITCKINDVTLFYIFSFSFLGSHVAKSSKCILNPLSRCPQLFRGHERPPSETWERQVPCTSGRRHSGAAPASAPPVQASALCGAPGPCSVSSAPRALFPVSALGALQKAM